MTLHQYIQQHIRILDSLCVCCMQLLCCDFARNPNDLNSVRQRGVGREGGGGGWPIGRLTADAEWPIFDLDKQQFLHIGESFSSSSIS